jgi:hypothetical protein
VVSVARGVREGTSEHAHEEFSIYFHLKKSSSVKRCRGQGVGTAHIWAGEGGNAEDCRNSTWKRGGKHEATVWNSGGGSGNKGGGTKATSGAPKARLGAHMRLEEFVRETIVERGGETSG